MTSCRTTMARAFLQRPPLKRKTSSDVAGRPREAVMAAGTRGSKAGGGGRQGQAPRAPGKRPDDGVGTRHEGAALRRSRKCHPRGTASDVRLPHLPGLGQGTMTLDGVQNCWQR